MFLKIPLAIVLVFSSLSYGLIWEVDEETIGIDERTEADITENEFQLDAETPTTTSSVGKCVTPRGFRGTCITLEECYPFVKYIRETGNDDEQILEIVSQSIPCDSNNVTVICCPTYSYADLKAKPVVNVKPASSALNQEGCGNLTFPTNPVVVGGREAQVGEFPWTVALVNSGKHLCGGSIIDKTHILTAAHCLANNPKVTPSSLKVLVGSHTSPSGGTPMTVKSMFYNKNFNSQQLGSDVAILKLAQPITYSSLIQPVCLHTDPPSSIPEDANAVLSGWGLTTDRGRPSPVLRTVSMHFIKKEDCKKRYQASGTQTPPIRDSHICASGKQGSALKDACYGDSGGPLVIFRKAKAIQVGVVSWGLKCGQYPGVYESASNYLAWIERVRKI